MSELKKNETYIFDRLICSCSPIKKVHYHQRSAVSHTFLNYVLVIARSFWVIAAISKISYNIQPFDYTHFSIPTRKLREIIIGHKWFSISSWIRMACTGFVMKCYCCRIYSVDGIYKRFYSFVKWKEILTYWNKIKYENTNKYSF